MNKIVFDIMSGEEKPTVALNSAINFAKDFPSANLIVVGSKELLENSTFPQNIETIISKDIITMNDSNPLVYRTKKESSLAIALQLLKENKAQAMLSCANTGAYLTGAFLQSKPITKDIRPALAGFVKPNNQPKVLLDLGAVIDCDAKTLADFAKMGQIYHSIISGKDKPTSALLQNGSEDHKGNAITKEAHKLFVEDKGINFFGNIEAKELFTTKADVLVADGFTGNHILKSVEGTMKFVSTKLKGSLTKNLYRKLLALMLKPALKEFKQELVSTAKAGGAVMLGLNHIVIKSPGSSGGETMYNGLKLANTLLKNNILDKIKKEIL